MYLLWNVLAFSRLLVFAGLSLLGHVCSARLTAGAGSVGAYMYTGHTAQSGAPRAAAGAHMMLAASERAL